jgi:1-pyrroline-5-carboxylate dehydrogenase
LGHAGLSDNIGGMDAITFPPVPTNEPNLTYAPGTPERAALAAQISVLEGEQRSLDAYIGGEWTAGGGEEIAVVQPHDHAHVLGTLRNSDHKDAQKAIEAATEAAPGWRAMPFDEKCAILLKAAELLAGPWRQRINAATVLGQSKTAFQAEIDAACELIDFWRFNVHYAKQILTEQPIANSPGIWNRTDHRPLEGFVYAIAVKLNGVIA